MLKVELFPMEVNPAATKDKTNTKDFIESELNYFAFFFQNTRNGILRTLYKLRSLSHCKKTHITIDLVGMHFRNVSYCIAPRERDTHKI